MHLTLLLDMAADTFGDRIAVGPNNTSGTNTGGTTAGGFSADELRRRAQAGAAQLTKRNASALVYLDVYDAAYPVALFAAAYAGVPFVPVNYRLGGEQLSGLTGRHPGALIVGSAPDQLPVAEWMRLCDEEEALSVPEIDFSEDGPPAVIIYTSGTTAAPKGVLLRHQHLASYVTGTVEFMSAAEEDANLITVPPYHIAAVANTLSSLYAGRRIVPLPRFDAGAWLETVRTEQITNAFLVPTMLARIVGHPDASDVATLRAVSYGGAPMPATVIERALKLWPDVGFVNAYGSTETSSTIAILGPEDHRTALASDDPKVRARLSSAGQPIPAVDLLILDDSGSPVPSGTVGRICVRGDQVSGEYDTVGTTADADGFFDTRDEGYLDADGFLFVRGRADDTIIRGGENIAPAEIEGVLLEDPSVADAVVIGVADDEWGQRLEAVVVPGDGATVDAEALRELVRTRLRGSKTPDRVHVVSALPRTDTGKLVRRDVPDLLNK